MGYVFQALATDFDGTLTETDHPTPQVAAALADLRRDAVRLVLVTGRTMRELREVYPAVDAAFDAIVAENGAVLVRGGGGTRLLTESVPAELHAALVRRGVPITAGEVLLACGAQHESAVLEEVRRLGLDCQLLRNRAALMVLPAGVTKGTGLLEALGELGVSHHSTLAIGDAENDQALLAVCEVGVAVANAVPALRARADLVLDEPDGAGVVGLLRDPILRGQARLHSPRWQIIVGHTDTGRPVTLPASQRKVLVAGAPGTGKSHVGGLLAEQLVHLRYSVLIVDLEGDHHGLAELRGVLEVGGADRLPEPHQIEHLLRNPFTSVVVNLSSLDPAGQEGYLAELTSVVARLRETCGLPHWLVVDEAHRSSFGRTTPIDAVPAAGACLMTYRPGDLGPRMLEALDAIVVLPGVAAGDLDALMAGTSAVSTTDLAGLIARAEPGQAVLVRSDTATVELITLVARRTRHVRHWHKYVHAALPEHLRFAFCAAPGERTGEIAANVAELHRIVGNCHDAAIEHHATHGDFSRWVTEALSDHELGNALSAIEHRHRGSAATGTTRAAIRAAVEERYLG